MKKKHKKNKVKYKLRHDWIVSDKTTGEILGQGREKTEEKALEKAEAVNIPAGVKAVIELCPRKIIKTKSQYDWRPW
jgi:hypothetical protein